jgi:hypothetical protein
VVFLQNCIDLRSSECGCNSGMCAKSSEVGNDVFRVQIEGVTEVTEGEDCEAMTSSLIRTDPGVGFMSVECLACFIDIQNCLSLYVCPSETIVEPWGIVLSTRDDKVTRRLYL